VIDTQLEIGNAEDLRGRDYNGLMELDAEAAKGKVQDEYELMALDNKVASARRKVESFTDRLAREAAVTSPTRGVWSSSRSTSASWSIAAPRCSR